MVAKSRWKNAHDKFPAHVEEARNADGNVHRGYHVLEFRVAAELLRIGPYHSAEDYWAPLDWQLLLVVSEYMSALLEFLDWFWPELGWEHHKQAIVLSKRLLQPRSPATYPTLQIDPQLRAAWQSFTYCFWHGTRHLPAKAPPGEPTAAYTAARDWLSKLVGDRGYEPEGHIVNALNAWVQNTQPRLQEAFPSVDWSRWPEVAWPDADCACRTVEKRGAIKRRQQEEDYAVRWPLRVTQGRPKFNHQKMEARDGFVVGIPPVKSPPVLGYLAVSDVMCAFKQATQHWPSVPPSSNAYAAQQEVVQSFVANVLRETRGPLAPGIAHEQFRYLGYLACCVLGWQSALLRLAPVVRETAAWGAPPLVLPGGGMALMLQPSPAFPTGHGLGMGLGMGMDLGLALGLHQEQPGAGLGLGGVHLGLAEQLALHLQQQQQQQPQQQQQHNEQRQPHMQMQPQQHHSHMQAQPLPLSLLQQQPPQQQMPPPQQQQQQQQIHMQPLQQPQQPHVHTQQLQQFQQPQQPIPVQHAPAACTANGPGLDVQRSGSCGPSGSQSSSGSAGAVARAAPGPNPTRPRPSPFLVRPAAKAAPATSAATPAVTQPPPPPPAPPPQQQPAKQDAQTQGNGHGEQQLQAPQAGQIDGSVAPMSLGGLSSMQDLIDGLPSHADLSWSALLGAIADEDRTPHGSPPGALGRGAGLLAPPPPLRVEPLDLRPPPAAHQPHTQQQDGGGLPSPSGLQPYDSGLPLGTLQYPPSGGTVGLMQPPRDAPDAPVHVAPPIRVGSPFLGTITTGSLLPSSGLLLGTLSREGTIGGGLDPQLTRRSHGEVFTLSPMASCERSGETSPCRPAMTEGTSPAAAAATPAMGSGAIATGPVLRSQSSRRSQGGGPAADGQAPRPRSPLPAAGRRTRQDVAAAAAAAAADAGLAPAPGSLVEPRAKRPNAQAEPEAEPAAVAVTAERVESLGAFLTDQALGLRRGTSGQQQRQLMLSAFQTHQAANASRGNEGAAASGAEAGAPHAGTAAGPAVGAAREPVAAHAACKPAAGTAAPQDPEQAQAWLREQLCGLLRQADEVASRLAEQDPSEASRLLLQAMQSTAFLYPCVKGGAGEHPSSQPLLDASLPPSAPPA